MILSEQNFHPSRTQVDLKDKWRAMTKDDVPGASPSAKKQKKRMDDSSKQLAPQTHFRPQPIVGAPRRRVKWHSAEIKLLEKGVKEFGTKWTSILTTMNGFHECRTSLDLKDKWRNLQQAKGE